MGVTCIADTREDADELYEQVVETSLGVRPNGATCSWGRLTPPWSILQNVQRGRLRRRITAR